MDLLLDVELITDFLAGQSPLREQMRAVLERCARQGSKVWVYAASAQTLEEKITAELQKQGAELSQSQMARQKAKYLLHDFVQDKQWLAALPGELDVFSTSGNLLDEQLLRALDRFPPGVCKLLTRNQNLLQNYPDKTISPENFLTLPEEPRAIDFIDLKQQQEVIRTEIETAIHRVLHHGQYILGPEIKELEAKLCEYTGAKYCVSVASGTEALLIALMALGVGPGDEVITSPFTFIATAEVIALLGATPVFVDIEPDTCNMDVTKLEEKITKRTKAIMPVSLYGQVADMDEINAIAAKYNLPVIEDAAQSFGAEYKGRKSCNLSTIGCTSFFPSKPLGCYGDGGAMFTNDENLCKIFREIRVHGQEKRYYHTRIGVGGRMDTIQAAIVLAKLKKFSAEVTARLEIGARYNQMLDELGVERVQQRPDRTSVYAQYTVMVDNRVEVEKKLNSTGIPTAVHYPAPLHRQPVFANLKLPEGSFPVAEKRSREVLSLPMHPYLDLATQQRICQVLSDAVKS